MNEALKNHAAKFPDCIIQDYLVSIHEIPNFKELKIELKVWTDLHYTYLSRKWLDESHKLLEKIEIYTDASGAGIGAAQIIDGRRVERQFDMPLWLADRAIHVKEGYAIFITLQSYGKDLYNSRVIILCDNEGVCKGWNGTGSRDIDLARVFSDMHKYCHDHNIHVTLKWVSTKEQEADDPSREITPVFSRLKTNFCRRLVDQLGVDLDLFASFSNRVGDIPFYSEYPHPNAFGVDGMSYTGRTGHVCYAYPPRVLILPFLRVRSS